MLTVDYNKKQNIFLYLINTNGHNHNTLHQWYLYDNKLFHYSE